MSGIPGRDFHDRPLSDDVHLRYGGRDLVFVLRADGDRVGIIDPIGRTRSVDAPWRTSPACIAARLGFDTLSRRWLSEDGERRTLVRDAMTWGGALFDVLFDAAGLPLLAEALTPGRPRPLLVIHSEDDALLALPWELLHYAGMLPGQAVPLSSFLVGDGYLDVARTTLGEAAEGALLRPPQGPFKLVVNVSAPETSKLHYEDESYRITLALTESCRPVPTELGTLDDLVQTVRRAEPTGIHFSGHGYRGGLVFEGDEGEERQVPIAELIMRLRAGSDGRLPPFFYLASCHGNESGRDGAENSAAQLHRAGVAQVVGYFGPIHDRLSTRAEAALYAAIAEGRTTNYAVRQARQALARPFADADAAFHLRDEEGLGWPSHLADAGLLRRTGPEMPPPAAVDLTRHGMPFAWAQLVLYHRGPDHPLSAPVVAARREMDEEGPQRTVDVGARRLLLDEPADAPRRLLTGFIGRRREMHAIRRERRKGARVFVFQGLGGLGKTTLAFHVLSLLGKPAETCTLWCHLAEKQPDRLEVLLQQFLDYCRQRVEGWDAGAAGVDREVGADAAQRFLRYLQHFLQKKPRLVLNLDNLESLMNGPPDDDSQPPRPEAFAEWNPPQAGALWRELRRLAENGNLYLVASCRYCHIDFADDRMPVGALSDDALFRMMEWFPGLRRLAAPNRARLVVRLNGHPRQVEYANDLIESRLAEWTFPRERTTGRVQREWAELVQPVLPKAQGKLWDNLLLGALWQRVLNDRDRRMLYRMTLLRRPWTRDVTRLLGEAEEPESIAEATETRLERTSLLEVRIEPERRLFTLHPATSQYVERCFPPDESVRLATHRRVGEYLEAKAKTRPDIEIKVEAGYHQFQAGEYNRAYELLGSASDSLQEHGRVREGLAILEPFLGGDVCTIMQRELVGRLHGTVGTAYHLLGRAEKAIGYHEQHLKIAREVKDRLGEGNALGSLGNAYHRLGQAEKAVRYHEDRLKIAREVKDRRGEGKALGNLGLAYAELGQAEKAVGYHEQDLKIAREVKDRRGEGNALLNLGNAYARLGQTNKAVGLLEQALQIGKEVKDPETVRVASLALTRLERPPEPS